MDEAAVFALAMSSGGFLWPTSFGLNQTYSRLSNLGSYSVLATNDVSVSLSSVTDSKGIGIIGGQITYFDKGNGEYGVRIDKVDFSVGRSVSRDIWANPCAHNFSFGLFAIAVIAHIASLQSIV